jgi:hypothetical protein
LTIVDVSQPEAPAILSILPIYWLEYDVAVSGSTAYVPRTNPNRISAVDVSDPETPTIVTDVPLPSPPGRLTVAGDHLYVGTGGGLVILDISDPLAPFIAGTSTGYTVHKAVVSGDYAVVAGSFQGVRVVDVSDPSSPVVVGSVPTPGSAWAAAVSGTTAFVTAMFRGGLVAIDFSEPASPRIVGSIVTESSEARDVVRVGQHLLVAAYLEDIQVVGYEIPASPPALVGSVPFPSGSTCIAALGSITCVGGETGLHVLDVSDAASPAVIGHYDLSTTIEGVAMSGSRAYLASSNMLHIVDLADPSAPAAISTTATTGMKKRVFVDGIHAYVLKNNFASDLWYVEVYDLSNELSPVLVGSVEVQDARDLAVSGTWAYVSNATGVTGLQVVDLSDPFAPTVAATLPLPDGAGSIAVSVAGSLAALSSGAAIFAVDVTDPTAPVNLGGVPHPGIAGDLQRLGSFVYTATGTRGVHVVNVEVVPPEIVGTFDATGQAMAIAEGGGRIQVVTRGLSGPGYEAVPVFVVLEPQCETAVSAPLPRLAAGISVGDMWPQPALGTQRLELTLAQAMDLRVRVLDVRGAVVRTLVDRRLAPGAVTLHWDGRDDAGRSVAGGVYFLRADGGASFTRRAVRLR